MTTPTQAGWYDDPHDSSAQRYWDGNDWTPYRQRKGAGAAPPPAVAAQLPTYAPPAEPPSYAAAAQPPVVAAQPPSYAAQQPSYAASAPPSIHVTGTQPPDSHLVMAVLSTFLCCFPFGIVAIINANKVANLWALGQYDAAKAAADSARKWAMYSAIAWACTAGAALFIGVVLPILGLSLLGGTVSPQP